MASGEFTIEDLRRILHDASGESEEADVDVDTLDVEFVELGYDSLALLETARRIELETGIKLDDETLADAATPRALIEAINAQLCVPEAS